MKSVRNDLNSRDEPIIDIEFKLRWFWFIFKGKLYNSFNKEQLMELKTLLILGEYIKYKPGQFDEIYSESVVGGVETASPFESFCLVRVEGLGVVVLNKTLEV